MEEQERFWVQVKAQQHNDPGSVVGQQVYRGSIEARGLTASKRAPGMLVTFV